MKRLKDIVVFTDGSCSGNGRPGAIGGIGVHFPDKELKDLSHVYSKGSCTNQRAELYAIVTALRYIRKELGIDKYRIYIKTDSKYSIDCITKWIKGWLRNGWKTSSGTDVMNRDLIEIAHRYYEKYPIVFIHVNSHTGGDDEDSIANEIADRLATRATERARKKNGSKVSKPSASYRGLKIELVESR